MTTIFIIVFAQFISVMTCAFLQLLFHYTKQDFPPIAYRVMAVFTLLGTLLALFVFLPIVHWAVRG